jgi:hemin uptake protein HemP
MMAAFSTQAVLKAAETSVPVHDAEALTDGGTHARIVLGDQIYVLRITRAGKLILTK